MTEAEIKNKNGKIAVILVRGLVRVSSQIKDTLLMMNLTRKNQCVIINDTPVSRGMIKKVKDYVTWGDIDEKTLSDLISKRGQEFQGRLKDRKGKYSYKSLVIDGKNSVVWQQAINRYHVQKSILLYCLGKLR